MSTLQPIAENSLKTFSANATAEERGKLQNKIQTLVGQVFFGTIMKEMRSEMDSSNPMNGGKAGQTYMAQLDQYLIEKMASSTNFDVGQKIAESWMGSQTSAETGKTTVTSLKDVEKAYNQTSVQDGQSWQTN
jgi:hypothetical protein